jgi:hypothetical protein
MKRTKPPIQLLAAFRDRASRLKHERFQLRQELAAIVSLLRSIGLSYEDIGNVLGIEQLRASTSHPPKRLARSGTLWREELAPFFAELDGTQ